MPARKLTVSFAFLSGAIAACTAATFAGEEVEQRHHAQQAAQHMPLQGNVKKLLLTLTELKDAQRDLKRVRELSNNLYDEAMRREVSLMSSPNVIGPMAFSVPSRVSMGAYLPPRKKWVDLFMAEMAPIIKLMQEDVQDVELIVEGEHKEQLEPLFKSWVSGINDCHKHLQELIPLTAKPPYDNAAVARACAAITKDVKELERIRVKIYKIVRQT